ncbi:MAG: oxygen-independent coproporphyrinogen III oxidase [Pseudomonadota bacterium]
MDHVNILRDYGLFDAKVPRYTSYPPANRFELGIGARYQAEWLKNLPPDDPVSVYIHIPFCRRLCWFCACRTQGTSTLGPVARYVDVVAQELLRVAELHPKGLKVERLHLGGGTPTLLTPDQMTQLLDAVFEVFEPTESFEFSVEIDPTDAAQEVLEVLAGYGMRRASIGVQDFAPIVQDAIGRQQSFEQTHQVVTSLRSLGLDSLNIDLLYGLPHQTNASLRDTLDLVQRLDPDRLALYGYAHVPHMSKRQSMIPQDALPDAYRRYLSAQMAKDHLEAMGYVSLGIDHFAKPSDSLARTARAGGLRRNFQGYTDDPCATLLGFGASAISKFPAGYVQNAVATVAYQQRVRDGQTAGHKGYVMSSEDLFLAEVISQVMCEARLDGQQLSQAFPEHRMSIPQLLDDLALTFPKAFERAGDVLTLKPGLEVLARLIGAHCDIALQREHIHSAAI